MEVAIRRSKAENGWFPEENIRMALIAIAKGLLDPASLQAWAARYPIRETGHPAKTIGLVMAGNLPLVGFHDWLCVFVSGNKALVKLSEKDKQLLPLLIKKMGDWAFESWEYTEFLSETDHLKGIDAVIATGSNNTARYFEQYFGKYPNVIRRNRNGVGVLTGLETTADLLALGNDVFSYFGLGCRNVSKLYVPAGYNFEPLLETFHEYREIVLHDKYKNNFDYNMTLFLMGQRPFLNNGCVMLVEDNSLQSRIASIHYEFYTDLKVLASELIARKEDIQCVVGSIPLDGIPVIPFGTSQQPGLNDYPDGVDIMSFLTGPAVTG